MTEQTKNAAATAGVQPGWIQDLKIFFKDLVSIAIFFMIFTTVGWASFHIPSGSMEPTLEVGDRIFVSKFAYGYNQYSLPFDPPVGEGKILEDIPERGDIAVFSLPHRDNTDFIKRVIGVPGDRIRLSKGRLYINGEQVKRTFVRHVNYTSYSGFQWLVKEYIEELPGGSSHRIYERTDRGRVDNTPLFVVPKDHYFMMGDNRDGSADSREPGGFSFVHKKFIVGRAEITTFSLYDCDQGKDIYCPAGIPLGRFFNDLDS